MILPEYLTKKFDNKKQFLHYLKDNSEAIIDMKKSSVYKSYEKGMGLKFVDLTSDKKMKELGADKSFNIELLKPKYKYPVISSTNFLDSHLDVHLKGCFKKTVNEKQGKVYFIDTHLKGLANIITRKDKIRMFYNDISWASLGKNYDGYTEGLFFEIKEDDIREDALDFINDTDDLECSLAMQYINILFACKSNDPAFKEENDLYKYYKDEVVNQDVLSRYEAMFLVKELAIKGEGSICPVVGGSNSATRVLYTNSKDDNAHTQTDEPHTSTQKNEPTNEIKKEDLQDLLNIFETFKTN